MIRLTLIFGLLALSGAGCHKSAKDQGEQPFSALSGKWEYVASYAGTGGPTQWEPAQPSGTWVYFAADGSFHTNNSQFSSFDSFSIIDSVKVKLGSGPIYPAGNAVLFFYHFDPATGYLELGAADPICIEGCASRFIRYLTN